MHGTDGQYRAYHVSIPFSTVYKVRASIMWFILACHQGTDDTTVYTAYTHLAKPARPLRI